MNFNIAVLPGDGIGPEIIEEAKKVVLAVCKRFNHSASFNFGLVGATAIDQTGTPLPDKTLDLCKSSDAVLFSELSATQNMIIIPRFRSGLSRVF
jgi:3-isopropylmalate dehydrogenase